MEQKKIYKVEKSKLFKEQLKSFSQDDQKKIENIISLIAKDPLNAPGSMSLCSKPSAKELKNWMHRTRPYTTNAVLEYLSDKGCLNKKGQKLAHEFWEAYIYKED